MNKDSKQIDSFYVGLDTNGLLRLGVDYTKYRYVIDKGDFLRDVLIESHEDGSVELRRDLDCYFIPTVIDDDAGIYLYRSDAMLVYHGVHVNLYRVLLNVAIDSFPSLSIPKRENRKPNVQEIGRVLFEKLKVDFS